MLYLLFVIGFVFLIKGADWLVDGGSSLGRRLHISDLVIGLTIVAFGTSTPELFVNVIASIRGNADIAIGNILGSNIANIFLILGVAVLISPVTVGRGTVWKEIPLSLLAVLLLGVMANDRLIDQMDFAILSRSEGLVFLAFFLVFMFYTATIARRIEGMDNLLPHKTFPLWRAFLMVLAGIVGLALGGKWVVDGAVHIAEQAGVSQSMIGLTIVSIGTSLPELATSAVAAYKKNVEIAVGNVVGSNIFNIFMVLGVSAVIKPLPFPAAANFDIGVVIFASLLLFLFMFIGKKHTLDRKEGLVFLFLYLIYIGFTVYRG
ncbi:MAG: Inner membrane protein YrbG [Planctomycetes bacterium ADurb.Bin412]|nr:MAG: Inner membrane protein YrbG [Planctomycetes bacterium ADurb.Bin412]